MLEVAGHQVRITSPSKVYFPELGLTKLELIRYYRGRGRGAGHSQPADRAQALRERDRGLPEEQRPEQDPDYDPWARWREQQEDA